MSARSVCNCGGSADTAVMVSLALPTSNAVSTRVAELTGTSIFCLSSFLKPFAITVNEYVPGAKSGM